MGKVGKKTLIVYIVILMIVGCSQKTDDNLELTLSFAGANSKELKSVITHYSESPADSLKLKASQFLISNMYVHNSRKSKALDMLSEQLLQYDSIVPKDKINKMWKALSVKDTCYRAYDAQTLDADFLTKEIDTAFNTWQNSAWKEDVDFNMFCKYILPYRFKDEPLKEGWRDSLVVRYGKLVSGIKDMDVAFGKVYSAIYEDMKAKTDVPYPTDPLTMQRIFRGTCLQRALYVGSVMRALGLPVTLDGIDHWANISTSGHCWIALIHKDGVATFNDKDSIAHRNNRIDTSKYPIRNAIENDYEYDTTFSKRVAKIERITYEIQRKNYEDNQASKETTIKFSNPFRKDVSIEYGLKDSICLKFPKDIKMGYLCNFITGKGWQPVCYAPVRNKTAKFLNIGDSVVYIAAYYEEDGKLCCVGNPFLLMDGSKKTYVPNEMKKRTIRISRKYPLTGNFISDWSMMRGALFQVSNDTTREKWKTVNIVTRTPKYRNVVNLSQQAPFKFLRYCNHETERIPHLAEVQFFYAGKLVKVIPSSNNCENVENCTDGNLFTALKGISKNYSVTFTLERPQKIDSIIYVPKNDGNFVYQGDEYELLYYNNKWVSLGCVRATGFDLQFNNVPNNAIMWLRDRTKGREERIFTVENGKQNWW